MHVDNTSLFSLSNGSGVKETLVWPPVSKELLGEISLGGNVPGFLFVAFVADRRLKTDTGSVRFLLWDPVWAQRECGAFVC